MKTDASTPMGTTLPERRLPGRTHVLVGVLSVGALLTLSLAGCGATVSVAAATPTAPRATASATLGTLTGAATPAITPAPWDGWATYHDPQFPFQVPIPPGWQPASLTWPPQSDPSGFTYYIVQFFPPGPHGVPGPGASSMAPELIEITITLSGPFTSSLAQNPGFYPEPGTVALGSTQVQLYDRGSPGNGREMVRAAETTLGTYPMLFEMHYLADGTWDPAIAQRDVALFLAMMQGYRPG
jgi:hypothetical protein